jgi:hypothetical protein
LKFKVDNWIPEPPAPPTPEEQCAAMFNIQLNDASLGMSFDEFHYNVVAQHFSNYTESQAKMAFDDCDLDKNGHLTSEEFMMLCKKF